MKQYRRHVTRYVTILCFFWCFNRYCTRIETNRTDTSRISVPPPRSAGVTFFYVSTATVQITKRYHHRVGVTGFFLSSNWYCTGNETVPPPHNTGVTSGIIHVIVVKSRQLRFNSPGDDSGIDSGAIPRFQRVSGQILFYLRKTIFLHQYLNILELFLLNR
ncbi:hypothetical protein Hanom_Chr12g01077961 [Helianthus anomalus]